MPELLLRLDPEELSAPDFQRRVADSAKTLLARFGLTVTEESPLESPAEICERLGISQDTFARRVVKLQAWKIPIEIHRGARGTIRRVRSSPAADRLFRTASK